MNIKEIARLSGVSTATVSRILNNSPNVREETRKHVLAVIQEAGYTPNAFARGLGLNSMRMIGIVCTDVSDIYYARAVSLLENQLREQGFDTLLCCTGNEPEDKRSAILRMTEKRVDALILVGSAFREKRDNSHIREAARETPVFIINGWVSIPNVYCVLCDEKEAMKNNVQVMFNAGCSNLLYIYDTLTYSGSQKLEGFHQGLFACSIPEKYARQVMVEKNIQSVRRVVTDILRDNTTVSGILTSDDVLAAGVLKAMEDMKMKLPLIGFNNSLIAMCTSPSLTSVDNMLDSLCTVTIGHIVNRLANGKPPAKTVLSAQLIIRESFVMEEETL